MRVTIIFFAILALSVSCANQVNHGAASIKDTAPMVDVIYVDHIDKNTTATSAAKVDIQTVAAAPKDENKELTAFIKKDFSKTRHPEDFPSPKVQKVFLFDYNHDGLTDGIVYAISHNPGAKFNFQGVGLYKNESGTLRLVDETDIQGNVSEVKKTAAGMSITTAQFAPTDAQCCPSITKTIIVTVVNDKLRKS